MLPRGSVAAPSLAVVKAMLNGVWRNLVWRDLSLPMAGGWDEMICKVLPTLTIPQLYNQREMKKMLF